MTASEKIAAHIAKRIMQNERRRFSSLYADALQQEIYMSTPTSSTLNGDSRGQTRPEIGRPVPDSPQALAAEAPAKLPGSPSSDSITSGMNIGGSQVTVGAIKPTDFKTLTGSYAGDHRTPSVDTAKASLDRCTDNGGPRNPAGQFRGSKHETQPPFASSPANLADSDSGT
jgi:hypothetical protein